MQDLYKQVSQKLKKPILIFFLIFISSTVLAEEFIENYIDPITYSKGDLRWCRLYGVCTFNTITTEAIITGNLSVIGEVFNVTMNLVTWNITESFNVGGNLVAENITANGNFIGNGSGITGISASGIEDIWVNETLEIGNQTFAQTVNGKDIELRLETDVNERAYIYYMESDSNILGFRAWYDGHGGGIYKIDAIGGAGEIIPKLEIDRDDNDIDFFVNEDLNDNNITNVQCLELDRVVCSWDEVNVSIGDINISLGTGEHWVNESGEPNLDLILRTVNASWNGTPTLIQNSSNISCYFDSNQWSCTMNGTDDNTAFDPSVLDWVNQTQLKDFNDTIIRNGSDKHVNFDKVTALNITLPNMTIEYHPTVGTMFIPRTGGVPNLGNVFFGIFNATGHDLFANAGTFRLFSKIITFGDANTDDAVVTINNQLNVDDLNTLDVDVTGTTASVLVNKNSFDAIALAPQTVGVIGANRGTASNFVTGGWFAAQWDGAGDQLLSTYGAQNLCYMDGSADATRVILPGCSGGIGAVRHQGTGEIYWALNYATRGVSSGGGNIRQWDSFAILPPAISGGSTIDNFTGLAIYSQGVGTNNWAIRSESTDPSVFRGNVGIGTATPKVKLDVAGGGNFTENITAENVFLPQYIFSHTNATIPVIGASAWTNVTFDQENADLKRGISHTATDGTNHTFTIMADGIYFGDFEFDVEDTSGVSTDIDVAGRLIYANGTEVIGSDHETGIAKKGIEVELAYDFLFIAYAGQQFVFQFIASDADVRISTHGTFGEHPESAAIIIKKEANLP